MSSETLDNRVLTTQDVEALRKLVDVAGKIAVHMSTWPTLQVGG